MLRFEWDSEKYQQNKKKHHVDFDEAKTVFDDFHALVLPDKQHSQGEVRERIVGLSSDLRILSVIFTEREKNVIRIISARKATSFERKNYERNYRKN